MSGMVSRENDLVITDDIRAAAALVLTNVKRVLES